MAYSDGLQLVVPMSIGNTTMGTMIGGIAGDVDDTAATLFTWVSPFPFQIEGFGMTITETFATSGEDAIWALSYTDKDTTITNILTIDCTSTGWSRGDGNKASVTALTVVGNLLIGDVFVYTGTGLPFQCKAGTTITVRMTTNGSGTGEVVPALMIRPSGYDLVSTRILTLDAAR